MAEFRAGAARTVITPRLGVHLIGFFNDRIAQDVHDDLYVRALVLESGDTSLAIAVCDLCLLLQEDIDRAKVRASELTGIPPENIFVSVTHTHYGPATVGLFNEPREEDYMAWLPDRIADAIKLAQNRLQPAILGHESGSCPEEQYNRRYLMKDGSVQMNPGYQNPDIVKPAGPTDPEIGVLAVLDMDRCPIAAVGNYPLHYVGGPHSYLTSVLDPHADTITADYCGAFDRAIQRIAGAEFVGVMLNGCCGDINCCNFLGPPPEYPHPYSEIERVADVLAAESFQAWRRIRDFQEAPVLAVANDFFTFRRREVPEEQLESARKRLQEPPDPADPAWMYANETMAVDQMPLEQETQIQAMRIGDLALVGLPGEIFVEIGMEIKQRSPFQRTLIGELANDWVGYIPTDQAMDEGSYETETARSSRASRGTASAMAKSAVKLLESLAG